ncbi:cation:proton antiporter [Natronogracilivirga saccharolytica]|uniref:Cation:proton antiporter n=1 Tax=Natronogracilivirga saccharolytica TaxID=2812953 RepID=A0A8J7RSW9_9BACT|nr:cation:proton antiporter [Natronogracilivirga saccharolytica]MBP3192357.1 cation:proton antiporter [Natronogracilivirga saccharolytica]
MSFLDFLDLPFSDPVLIFALVMVIILTVPIVADKLRVPAIVGLIFAGALVGQGALGLLERDDTIILLGTVGLLYLMFIAGISIDLEKFSKFRERSLSFGIISFGLPLAGSMLLAPALLDYSTKSALLLGAIVGSHTLLAYPIANRLGIGKNTAVTMSLGATIVTDALSLTILAIVAATMHGELDASFWLTFLGFVTLYLVVVVFTLPRLGRWFFRNVRDQTNIEYVFLLTVLFVTAYFAQLVGLAAIIGAFLAGLTMNRLVPENSTLMSRVQFVGNALFIPFFLISVGMLVDFRVLVSIEVWLIALLFFLLVMIGKYAAAKAVQLYFRFSSEEGWIMMGLTSPQAAATLAVTLIGFDLGLFDEMAVNAVVLLIMSSCFVGPYLVDLYGRRLVLQEEKASFSVSDAPERILVPLSNPDTSEALMDIAIMIRGNKSTEPIFPLTVARETRSVEADVASGEKLLSHAVVHAAAADVPVIPVTRVDYNIASGIVRATKELRISDIVIGWNGVITARQRIFGSVLDQLMDQSDETILVSKIEQPINTCERTILVLPPMAQYEPGFGNSFQTVKKLINQLGTKVVVLSMESNQSILKPFIENQEPELKAEYKLVSNWNNVYNDISNIYDADSDLVILFSSRRGTIAWQPSFERLPGQIIRKVTPQNLIIVYPAEVEDHSNPTAILRLDESPLTPDMTSNQIYIATDADSNHASAIENLVKGLFPDRSDVASQIAHQLKSIDPDNLPGDLPGMMLQHLSTHFVDRPRLLLAINEKGFHVKKYGEPVKVMFILLSPTHMSMQRNLLILNRLARIVGDKKTRNLLAKAKNIDDIRKTLSARLTILPPNGENITEEEEGKNGE